MYVNDAFCRLQNMMMAKFVANVFLISIFGATFADQNVKSDKWRFEPSKKQNKKTQKKQTNKNNNIIMKIWKNAIPVMNLESAILVLTKCPKVT